jgi:hypothetical protein
MEVSINGKDYFWTLVSFESLSPRKLNVHQTLITNMFFYFQKIPKLETLNLAGCKHLTDKTLQHLEKLCPNLQYLNICDLQLITQDAIINVLATAPSLVHLDIFFNRNIKKEMYDTIEEILRRRNISLVLKGLTDRDVSPSNAAESLSKFRMVVI